MATRCRSNHADRSDDHVDRSFLPMPFVFTLIISLVVLTPASAQDEVDGRQGDGPTPKTEKTNETSEADEQDDPEKGPILALVGGDIVTITGPIIRSGTVLVQDGKILKVGQDLDVPEGAEVIDTAGKTITPGFIALSISNIGINTSDRNSKLADILNPYDRTMKYCLGVGITSGCALLPSSSTSSRRSSQDTSTLDHSHGHDHGDHDHSNDTRDKVDLMLDALASLEAPKGLIDQVPPSDVAQWFDVIRFDPHSYEMHGLMPDGAGGFYSCCEMATMVRVPAITAPVPKASPPRKNAVIKLSYGSLEPMVVEETPFYYLASSALAGPYNRYKWRENVKKAQEYVDALARYEEEKSQAEAEEEKSSSGKDEDSKSDQAKSKVAKPKAPRKTVSDELIKLVKREIPLRVDASSLDLMRDMIDLAEELDYDLVLEGVHEAWLMADELGEESVSVIVTPRSRRRPRPGLEITESGSSIETVRYLEQAGVPFAITALSSGVSLNGLAGRDLTSLPLEAAFAVRGGASEQAALEALTIVPARILGLEDRLGSIEEGKDADLLILEGDPLDYRTYVETTIVAGQICYQRDDDRVYPVFSRD